jgi:hypothetical protein
MSNALLVAGFGQSLEFASPGLVVVLCVSGTAPTLDGVK